MGSYHSYDPAAERRRAEKAARERAEAEARAAALAEAEAEAVRRVAAQRQQRPVKQRALRPKKSEREQFADAYEAFSSELVRIYKEEERILTSPDGVYDFIKAAGLEGEDCHLASVGSARYFGLRISERSLVRLRTLLRAALRVLTDEDRRHQTVSATYKILGVFGMRVRAVARAELKKCSRQQRERVVSFLDKLRKFNREKPTRVRLKYRNINRLGFLLQEEYDGEIKPDPRALLPHAVVKNKKRR